VDCEVAHGCLVSLEETEPHHHHHGHAH